MDLLPGLPYDMAIECLIRLPLRHLSSAAAVCKGWKAEIALPDFPRCRKLSGVSQSVIVVAQAWVDPTSNVYSPSPPFYRLAAFYPETRKWSDIPPVPDFPDGLPVLCQLAGVGSELVIIGGCDPVDWRVLDSVFIYNFFAKTWRRGARMPGGQRLLFGCATDSARTVYVAGGHDEDRRALRSALAYDVAGDRWAWLPDMATARDECSAVFHRGKFQVIGGYSAEMQGAETFHVATRRWGPVEGGFLDDAACPKTCVEGDDGRIYKCCKGRIEVREDDAWRVLVGLPDEICHVDFATAWREKLFVIGFSEFGGTRKTYAMDVKDYKWEQIDTPREYSGHVQSGCYLEI